VLCEIELLINFGKKINPLSWKRLPYHLWWWY